MATEVWRWQNGGDVPDTYLLGAAILPDGSSVVAGSVNTPSDGWDFVAYKLSSDGELIWEYTNGTNSDDGFRGVAATDDGSTVLVGYVGRSWSSISQNSSDSDYFAVKLDANGTVIWSWQGGTGETEYIHAVTISDDGSIFMGGTTGESFAVIKLSANGEMEWQWGSWGLAMQLGRGIAKADDGSVLLVGFTSGNWEGDSHVGSYDFAALKVDADGNEDWRWQNGTEDSDILWAVVDTGDDAFIMSGYTLGSYGGAAEGGSDFVAMKIDANKNVLWTWQNGTSGSDGFLGAASLDGRIIAFGGYTSGDWNMRNLGDADFISVGLDGSDGTELWRWQDGTSDGDVIYATAASNDSILLAGYTYGSFASANAMGGSQAAVVMLQLNVSTLELSPTLAPLPSPAPTPPLPLTGDGYLTSTSRGPSLTDVVTAMAAAIAAVLVLAALVFCLLKRAVSTSCSGKKEAKEENASSGVRTIPAPSERPVDGRPVIKETQFFVAGDDGAALHPERVPTEEPPVAGHGFIQAHHHAIRVERRAVAGTAVSQGEFHGVNPIAAHRVDGDSGRDVSMPAGSVAGEEQERTQPDADRDHASFYNGVETDRARARLTATKSGEGATGRGATSSTASVATSRPSYPPSRHAPFFSSRADVLNTPSVSHGGYRPSASRDKGSIGVTEPVLQSAEKIAKNSTIPVISDAATLVSALIKLVASHAGNLGESDSRVQWCRSILDMTERADKLLRKGQGDRAYTEEEQVLLEEVRESIGDLVQIIQTYKSKDLLTEVMMSTLFKKRQVEAEAVICMATSRLQGTDTGEVMAECRRQRPSRCLDELEIPEDELTLTDEALGTGGFGTVFLADFNGRNAAAKVVEIKHALGATKGSDRSGAYEGETEKEAASNQRKAFMRELEVMARLRSPHTVNVYGAVTGRSDRLILVMELMAGSDLRSFLEGATGPVPERDASRIIRDVCAGMAFLHCENTIHGDLKSANVLFDGIGRAKIADVGTRRWSQHIASTDLATYSAKRSRHTQMSLPWVAPEVLEHGLTSYESDVYSFGMVVFEVLTGKLPWPTAASVQDIFKKVVIKRQRPEIPADAPAELADIARICWASEPGMRPRLSSVLESMSHQERKQE